jgi:hypothetical protein
MAKKTMTTMMTTMTTKSVMSGDAGARRGRRVVLGLACSLLLGALWLSPARAEAGFLSWLFGKKSSSVRTTQLTIDEQRAHWQLRSGERAASVRAEFKLGDEGEARIRGADPANTRWNPRAKLYEQHQQWKRRVR